jgi:hypothetical protein
LVLLDQRAAGNSRAKIARLRSPPSQIAFGKGLSDLYRLVPAQRVQR